jgi:hypothetical protein
MAFVSPTQLLPHTLDNPEQYVPMKPINGLQGESYLWKPNGSGGINYFKVMDSGTTNYLVPTNRETFSSNTGINTSLLENYVANPPTQPSTNQIVPGASQTESQSSQSQQTTQVGGGTTFQPIVYKGVTYTDESSYIAAVNKNIADTYESNLQIIERNYQNGLLSIDDRDAAIKLNRESLRTSYQTDMQNVSGYFNRISPEAIQSGQAKLQDQSTAQYNAGNSALGSEFDKSLYGPNGRLKSDLTDSQLAPYMSQQNTATGSLARQYSGYANQRTAQTQLAADQRQSGLDNTANAAMDYANKVTAPTVASQVYNSVMSGDSTTQNSGSPAITSKKKIYDENGNLITDFWSA